MDQEKHDGWRPVFRRKLCQLGESWSTAGELFDFIREQIPLHQAARVWRSRKEKDGGAQAGDFEVREVMLWTCFIHELCSYPVESDSRGHRVTRDRRVRPIFRPCCHCGKPYFAPHSVKGCCRTHTYRHTVGLRGQKNATLPPELRAIRAMVRILAKLDAADRDRVLSYLLTYYADRPRRLNGQEEIEHERSGVA